MNMYLLFKMFVLCYFCNIDMYIFDKINVFYFTLLYILLLEVYFVDLLNLRDKCYESDYSCIHCENNVTSRSMNG